MFLGFKGEIDRTSKTISKTYAAVEIPVLPSVEYFTRRTDHDLDHLDPNLPY